MDTLSGSANETGVSADSGPLDDRSKLLADKSFWGLNLTQFLGAFNDNVFKQLVLLLALPVVAADATNNQASEDMQGWATLVFSIPFVLFSGFAGYLSDRFCKTPIIVLSKVAEIVIMFLGLFAFLYYDTFGMIGTWTVLFLMATQSAFFGPGKYGLLPELFRASDLPRANGLILMATFLAIIFGVTFAGKLFDFLVGKGDASGLWIGSLFCIVVAVVGTCTSLLIRRTDAAQPSAKLSSGDFGISREMTQLLGSDRQLLLALLVSSVFWMVSTIAMPTVNRLGFNMLNLDKGQTGLLVGMIAVGIMLGAPLGGWLCQKLPSHRVVTIGLWGVVAALVLLGVWVQGNQLWLSANACRLALVLLGVSAAIYSIPLQVFLQDRPPSELKGRMIATMNQVNFLGMMLAGPIYQFFEFVSRSMVWPISSIFWMLGMMILPLALFYRMGERVIESKDATVL